MSRRALAFHAGQLGRNLAAGARLALFLPLQAHQFRVAPAQYALLVGFNLAFWIAASAARAGFEGELDASAIPPYLAAVALVLAGALFLSIVLRAPDKLLLLALALTASDPVFELAGLALPFVLAWTGHPRLLYAAFLGWAWLVAVRAVWVCAGAVPRAALARAAGIVTAMTAAALFILPSADVWVVPQPEEPADALVDERVFHLQGESSSASSTRSSPGGAGRRTSTSSASRRTRARTCSCARCAS